MRKIKCLVIFILCLVLLPFGQVEAATPKSEVMQTVKVGFFSSDGYHIIDDNDTMSGYGYDFLQMMLRYNNWKYEYVGYDCNWGDMLSMLDSGEIDMVTLANKTPEREKLYGYSSKAIGYSSTIMTISSENTSIIPGDYSTYDNAVVGLVKGSSHNENFFKYAKEKGFSYTVIYYEDINNLLADLRSGKNIDISVTSNMRIVQSEIILDEFNPTPYYAIVRKDNEKLLEQIDNGIDQLDVYSPDWRNNLFAKYYSDINSMVISFSSDEREYLNELRESGTVIKAAMNPELKPYSYFENGEAKGIAPEIFKKIAENIGIEYEIVESKDRWEYKEQISSGEVDIDLTAYLDYSLAQKYNLKETDAYITSMLSMLTRKDSNTDKDTMTIAVVRDPTEYIGYNSELIYSYNYKEYESIKECIDAVKNGEADATFRYVYIAEHAVADDYTSKLKYTIMPDYSFGLCIGVLNEEDHRLLSILNKGVNSLTKAFTDGVIVEQSASMAKSNSLASFAYSHPVYVIAAAVILIGIIFAIILLIIRNRNQKNKILASNETNRFISYICDSYVLVTEINLKTMIRTVYRMKDGVLNEIKKVHDDFDRDYFAKCVKPADVDRMHQCFCQATIDKMISEGGTQNYIECQVLDETGEYNWYSYIVKAVKADAQHPRNFVVFKKYIQDAKLEEEKHRQILTDALKQAEEASKAKGFFLSNMSHEIRTPLNAIIGYLSIAKDSGNSPEKIMHCVNNGQVAATHLLQIINDVLDMSSIENGKLKIANEDFDLKKEISDITTIFYQNSKAKKIEYNTVIDGLTEEWVVGDSLRLNQVLMNLLSNAVKFTPENGKVELTITQAGKDDKNVYLKFTVKDTGIGMSADYMKKLFSPFEQESASTARKFGGSGLGLSITRNLVSMMGGQIEAQSTQNVGTTFTVTLHFGLSDRHGIEKVSISDYAHVRALVVDDVKDECTYVRNILKRCGVKADAVTDPKEAIKKLRGRMGGDYEYQLCILDWNMPDVNGIELAADIRKEFGDKLPIIIATAYDVTELQDEAMAAGVNRVVTKPLFQSTMFDILVSTFGTYNPEIQSSKKEEIHLENVRVILAEDNDMNMEIAETVLNKAGVKVDKAWNGKEACDLFLNNPAGTYTLILMDVQMPVMDGYEATKMIRNSNHEQAASIPIVAMTANAFAEDVAQALAAGMNAHISKPINYDKLFEVISKYAEK